MKYLPLLLLISFQAMALTKEDLKATFAKKGEFGPLPVEQLKNIEDGLHELGHNEYFNNLKTKLGKDSYADIALYVHTCEMAKDTLGFYRRGTSSIYTSSVQYGIDLFSKSWGEDALKAMNEAFKVYQLDNHSHYSLVVEGWPIICIRPGEQFGSILGTFAHEVTHFVDDEEKQIDFAELENEADYVEKRLYQSGGEFEAFKISGLIAYELKRFEYNTRQGMDSFFEKGELVKEQDLADYILDTLNYKITFINDYRSSIVDAYNSNVNNYNTILSFRSHYEQNAEISRSNLEITKNNMKIFEGNIKYYQYSKNTKKLEEEKEKLSKAQNELIDYGKSATFYDNMVVFADATMERIKLKLDNIDKQIKLIK